MGRPKGSKNKSKLVASVREPDDFTGEVVVKLPVTTEKERLKNIDAALDQEENGGEEHPEDEAEVVSTEEATKAPFRDIRHKNVKAQLDFLFEEVKSLRAYITRIDDSKNFSVKRVSR